MSHIHKLRCRCGQLRGDIRLTGLRNRCVCYCTDCQAFPRHLRAPDVLDSRGGTDIVQVPPSILSFTQGVEKLACLRLSPKGLLRWYSTCCKTPIGNTPADWRISFVGLIHVCLRGEDSNLDASFGPVSMRVGVKAALGDDKPVASGLITGVAKAVALIARGRVGGRYRANPFFEPDSGLPITSPTVLSAIERASARNAA